MSILTVTNLEKSYGTDLLFQEVNFSIAAGQKMGLVGRNGCGKTTLLRILLGQELPDTGKAALAAGRSLGYLRQEAPVHPEHTILEEAQSVFAGRARAGSRGAAAGKKPCRRPKPMTPWKRRWRRTRTPARRSKRRAATGIEADIPMVLEKLGFSPADYGKRVGSCSGGEQTRLALAKIVLARPDLLILDEPTNHLDIAATEWLEGFLKSYEGAMLLVSHDRYFLDAVADTIGDLENQRLTVFKGNYSHFRRQKDERLARQQDMYEHQQAEIARLEAVIKKNMGGDSVQSKLRARMETRIERMDKVERVITDNRNVRALFDADCGGPHRAGRPAGRGPDQDLRRADAVRRPELPDRARRAGRAGRAERGGQDDPGQADSGHGAADARVGRPGPQRPRLLLLPARRRQPAPGPQRPRLDPRRRRHDRDRGAQLSRPVPVHRRRRVQERRDAVRRREEQAGPGPDDPGAVQPADPGRTDEPPGHRVLRGADRDAVQVRGDAASGLPRPLPAERDDDQDAGPVGDGAGDAVRGQLQRLARGAEDSRARPGEESPPAPSHGGGTRGRATRPDPPSPATRRSWHHRQDERRCPARPP